MWLCVGVHVVFVVWSVVSLCVVVVVCAVWCGTLNTSVCRFKTPPCVPAKRPTHHTHIDTHAPCTSHTHNT